MQIVFEDEVEGVNGRRASVVGIVIYAGRIGRCVERKCNGRTRSWGD